VFRLNRNERSHWSGNGVHVEPELVFMIGRNMQKTLEQARKLLEQHLEAVHNLLSNRARKAMNGPIQNNPLPQF
jgi:hypothetical protein